MNAKDLISEVISKQNDASSGGTLLADLDGWDSLKGVRIILRLEQIAGRELSEDEIEKIVSVGDIEKFLAET